MIKKIIVFVCLIVLLFISVQHYLGFYNFHKYEKTRERAKSIESGFPGMEESLKKALRHSKNPKFLLEQSNLYWEMAVAENQFGTQQKRDFFLDLAKESLEDLIKRNPTNASAYYVMGMVYMFYNYPLLTYAEKGRQFFVKALKFDPSSEFLNVNILYIYLTQWNYLEKEEQTFVLTKLQWVQNTNSKIVSKIRGRWVENYGDAQGLDVILKLI